MRAAQIRVSDNVVENVIVLDSLDQWTIPEFYVVESDTANIGDTYVNGEFVAPPEQPQE